MGNDLDHPDLARKAGRLGERNSCLGVICGITVGSIVYLSGLDGRTHFVRRSHSG